MTDNINLNDTSSASQVKRILAYMMAGNRITGIDALELFGCWRLPARIADIRKRGFNVQSEMVLTGTGKRVKAYWI